MRQLFAVLLAFAVCCPAQIRFEERPIPFVLKNGATGHFYLPELMPGGVGVIDYDGDGCMDVYFANGAALPGMRKTGPEYWNRLYRNDCHGNFTDVTENSGLDPDMYGIAVTAADYDNDGFIDLLVTGYGKTILYHNDGNGHFTDVTAKAGIKVDGWAISSTWLDYDKDGCTDLFVGRYVKFDPKYHAYYAPDGYPGPLD